MIYKATIETPFSIRKIIEPEILQYKNDFKRVRVEFETDSKILIEAKDSVSLRAVLNTISKLCTVYEKSTNLIQDNS